MIERLCKDRTSRRRLMSGVALILAAGLLGVAGVASASSQKRRVNELGIAPVSLFPDSGRGRVGALQHEPTNLKRMWDGTVRGKPKIFRTGATSPRGGNSRTLQAALLVSPTITSAPSNPSTSRTATFGFSTTDSKATFQCSLDNAAYTACTSPRTYTNLSYAAHAFRVRTVQGKNLSPITTVAWSIIPPAPTLSATPANPTSATSASFAFFDAVPAATFQCRIDGGAFVTCVSPAAYTLALGSHTFGVRALVGSVASAETTYTWTITLPGPLTQKAKLLLVAGVANELDLQAIKSTLDYAGVPYDTLIASTTDLTDQFLSGGSVSNYQGVILTTGNLTWLNPATRAWESAFTQTEWDRLWAWEAKFKLRQATLYTYPAGYPDDYGLTLQTPAYQDTSISPLSASLTDAGRQVFPYLNPSAPITWKSAWVYLATKRDATVTPLVQTASGQVIASTRTYPDGRENLAITGQNASVSAARRRSWATASSPGSRRGCSSASGSRPSTSRSTTS